MIARSRRSTRPHGLLAVVALALGCAPDRVGEAPGRGPTDGAARPIADAGPDARRPDAAPVDAAGMLEPAPTDASSELGPVDAAPPADARAGAPSPRVTIESCIDACARHAACVGLAPEFADPDACGLRCAYAEPIERARWFACLRRPSCEAVAACVVPAPPPSCAHTCERLQACDDRYDPAVCRPVCEAEPWLMRGCGRLVVEACEMEALSECLAFDVFPGCRSACLGADACGGDTPDQCWTDCTRRLLGGEPLGRRFTRRQLRCMAWDAEDCADVARCMSQRVVDEGPSPTRFAFCRAWSSCGADEPCGPVFDALRAGGLATVECGLRALGGPCDDGAEPIAAATIARCLDHPDLDSPVEDCVALADAAALCGQPEPATIACAGEGETALLELRRARSALVCLGATTCAQLEVCRDDRAPESRCLNHCARLADCDQAPPNCAERCVPRVDSRRMRRHLDCVERAASCDELAAACPLPMPAPCEAMCARLSACGRPAEGCALACDDDDDLDPGAHARLRACITDAPDCAAVEACALE